MAALTHGSLPWRYNAREFDPVYGGNIESGDGWAVARLWADVIKLNPPANADLIVRAVNSHYELVAALIAAKRVLELTAPDAPSIREAVRVIDLALTLATEAT